MEEAKQRFLEMADEVLGKYISKVSDGERVKSKPRWF